MLSGNSNCFGLRYWGNGQKYKNKKQMQPTFKYTRSKNARCLLRISISSVTASDCTTTFIDFIAKVFWGKFQVAFFLKSAHHHYPNKLEIFFQFKLKLQHAKDINFISAKERASDNAIETIKSKWNSKNSKNLPNRQQRGIEVPTTPQGNTKFAIILFALSWGRS